MENNENKLVVNPEKEKQKVDEIPHPSGLTLDERFSLAFSVGEECITGEELRNLLRAKPNPICYDGFEPSGRMHIAQGIMKAINVNKLTKVGCTFIFWVADWFALMNNKMGGDIAKIKKVGQYMIEVWKACGMDMTNVKFWWSSDEINANSSEYWMRVIDIARNNNLSRIKRCSQIMGREESDELSAAQIMYPCMQCADIFFLKADICQLGLDQRKVNMLAREYCDIIKKKFKPIILSHHMLLGLIEGQEKMSKSVPGSAIFMEDTVEEVNSKIRSCYCPPGATEIDKNPVVDYVKHIIFPKFGKFTIVRKEKGKEKEKEKDAEKEKAEKEKGKEITFNTFEEFFEAYKTEQIWPSEVKPALAEALNEIIQPVRDHFINNKEARELLALIKKWQAEAKKEKDKELQAAGEAAPKQQQKPKTPKTKQEGKKKKTEINQLK